MVSPNCCENATPPLCNTTPPEAPTRPDSPPAGPESPPAAPGYQDHRTLRELADAERAELETARMAGRLVEKDLVERTVFESFRELRDAVFAACKSQARRVQGLTEIREIELALEDELRDAVGGWEQRMHRRHSEAAAP